MFWATLPRTKSKNERGTSMRTRFTVLSLALLLSPAFVSAILGQTAPKPNFSGLWRVAPAAAPAPAARQVSVFQGGTVPPRPTRIQLALKLPLTPKGKELVEHYTEGDGKFGGET